MKLKIKVKELTKGCMPEINPKGDWIDLRSSVDFKIQASPYGNGNISMNTYYIPLGVAMELPKGFEAIINSRSSGPQKMKLFIPNGQGVIDHSYSGDSDEWNYVCSPMAETCINKGDRICQFRIQLSQKANIWQKLKWLFSNGIKIEKVDHLSNNNRGGFGTTGVK